MSDCIIQRSKKKGINRITMVSNFKDAWSMWGIFIFFIFYARLVICDLTNGKGKKKMFGKVILGIIFAAIAFLPIKNTAMVEFAALVSLIFLAFLMSEKTLLLSKKMYMEVFYVINNQNAVYLYGISGYIHAGTTTY